MRVVAGTQPVGASIQRRVNLCRHTLVVLVVVTVVVVGDQCPVAVVQPQVRVGQIVFARRVAVAVNGDLRVIGTDREIPVGFLANVIRRCVNRERSGDSENEQAGETALDCS